MKRKVPVYVDTLIFESGEASRNAGLLPLDQVVLQRSPISILEGTIELQIGAHRLLGFELIGAGYIDEWWTDALDAVAALQQCHSCTWPLVGKTVHVEFTVLPGTRRGSAQLVRQGHPSSSASDIEFHIPSLTDALLQAAHEFFDWYPLPEREARLTRLKALRAAPVPWRSR